MSDVALQEAREKAAEAKAWGQEQARAADEARRDLKKAQDAAASAAEVQAELDECEAQLEAANARISDLVAELGRVEKRAKKNEAAAADLAAVKSALGI